MPPRHISKSFYDKSAAVYDSLMKLVGTAPTIKGLIKTLHIDVPEDARVLDLGCGTGLATEAISRRFPEAEISGLDYSEEMLRIYGKKFPKRRRYVGDFNDEGTFLSYPSKRHVKMKPGSYDLIISSGAVSEYGRLDSVLPLTYRLLKEGGVFVNIGVKDHIINKITCKVWKYKPASERRFIKACEDAGYGDIEVVTIPDILFPTNILKYAVKARKPRSVKRL
jgi:ubiquinone/menaquinone biosynthesis C-methylase UbiE